MRNDILMKGLVLGILILFVTSSIVSALNANPYSTSISTKSGSWLYVGGSGPGNYTTIQDAINNAAEHDTIFVFDDSSPYVGAVFVLKSLTILGENKLTTILDSGGFYITADHVTITGFTIQNSDEGVHIGRSGAIATNNTIDNNIFSNVSFGISIDDSYNTITNNLIMYTEWGGIGVSGIKNTVVRNDVSQEEAFQDPYYAGFGISVGGSLNNISHNTVHDNYNGLVVRGTKNEVYRNSIMRTVNGVFVLNSFSDMVTQNNIIMYQRGARIWRFVEPGEDSSISPVIFEGNYWGRARILLYPIGGLFLYNPLLKIYIIASLFGVKTSDWILEYGSNFVRFDWHPAQQPYDISEGR